MSEIVNRGLQLSDIAWAWEGVSRFMLLVQGIEAIGLVDWLVDVELVYGLAYRGPEFVPFTMRRGGSHSNLRIWTDLADDDQETAMRNVFALMSKWHEGAEVCPHGRLIRG